MAGHGFCSRAVRGAHGEEAEAKFDGCSPPIWRKKKRGKGSGCSQDDQWWRPCCHTTKSLINVLNSAVSLLQDVSEGRGPTSIELSKMGDYVVTFAKTVENLCWIDIDETGIRSMPDTLYGAKALE